MRKTVSLLLALLLIFGAATSAIAYSGTAATIALELSGGKSTFAKDETFTLSLVMYNQPFDAVSFLLQFPQDKIALTKTSKGVLGSIFYDEDNNASGLFRSDLDATKRADNATGQIGYMLVLDQNTESTAVATDTRKYIPASSSGFGVCTISFKALADNTTITKDDFAFLSDTALTGGAKGGNVLVTLGESTTIQTTANLIDLPAASAANTAPKLKASATNPLSANVNAGSAYTSVDLSTIFEDAESNPLSYKVSTNGTDYADVTGNTYTSAIYATAGANTLYFKANDGTLDSTDIYTVNITVAAVPTVGSPKIELVIPRDTYAEGETFVVDVYVKSAEFNLAAYGISYNQNMLTLNSTTEATGFGVSRTDNLASSGKLGRTLYPTAGGESSVVKTVDANGVKIDSLSFTVKAGQSGTVALTPTTISGSPDLESKNFILACRDDIAEASIAVTYTETLADYKAAKCTVLDQYKDADDYATHNAATFANAVSGGKTGINAAATFAAVDSALAAAKGVIDAIETDAEIDAGGAVADVEALIDEISAAVEIGDKAKIRTAKTAYDALGASLQSEVDAAKAAKLAAAVKSLALWSKGDVNFDGIINAYDLSELLYMYGSADEASNINEAGAVNAEDLSTLLTNYGEKLSIS